MKYGLMLAALLALVACGGTPVQPTAEQAMAQQASTSDVRTRAKAHTELGAAYLGDERFGIAQDEARIAIASDPTYAPAFGLLALVHMYLNEKEAAEQQFRHALKLAPNDPEINNNFGLFLCRTGRERESIGHFMTAVKNPLYTTPTKPFSTAGLCSAQIGEDKAAEDYLARALRADFSNIQAHFGLAELFYRQNRLFEARQRLADLHQLVEANSQSIWLSMLIDRKLGDREGEARNASLLRRRFQGSPEHQKLLQGRYE